MSDYSNLVQRLRGEHGTEPWQINPAAKTAADAIELLQRELKCSKEMWEQQQELALEYLADIENANERIAEIETAYVRLSDKEMRLRQTLDDVWQDLYTILGHVRSALRETK